MSCFSFVLHCAYYLMWKINRHINPSVQPRLEEWTRLLFRMQKLRVRRNPAPGTWYLGTSAACAWATSALRAPEREHCAIH